MYGDQKSIICTNLSTRKCITSSHISPFENCSDIKWRPGATSTIGVSGNNSHFALIRKNKVSHPWIVNKEKQDYPHYGHISCFDWIDDSSLATGDREGAVSVWQFK